MSVLDEPKIDCHVHVFDPDAVPYGAGTFYAPAGQEIGTPDQLLAVMDAYGVRHALLVGPNSAYDIDNRLLLGLLAREPRRFRGMAVVPKDITGDELDRLADAGVVGVTAQAALLGTGFLADAVALIALLAERRMFLDLQVQHDQLLEVLPILAASDVPVVIDHCGRPDPDVGLESPGFQALLALGRSGRVSVKLSGLLKCSRQPYPYQDAWPVVGALLQAFGPQACVWGSDWPFLRAPSRVDYGPLLTLAEQLVPDEDIRRAILWDTPAHLFGFGQPRATDPQPGGAVHDPLSRHTPRLNG